MLDQLILATQLALEKVDSNEMKSVFDKAYTRDALSQTEQVNCMLNHESANALTNKESDSA